MNIDWVNLPYNHNGTWIKNKQSVMSPGTLVTWPQLLAEIVIYNRIKIIKSFPKVQLGPGWSCAIAGQVKGLIQQMHVICNYFEHPNTDPLVEVAFLHYFKNNKALKVGGFRKIRVTKAGKINITDTEKDTVKGLMYEFNRLKEQRDKFAKVQRDIINVNQGDPLPTEISFRSGETSVKGEKLSLAELIRREQNG
jgi:hypothetical protein